MTFKILSQWSWIFKKNPHFNGCKVHCIGKQKLVMCEWIHICSDIDSEQNMDKTTRAFSDLVRRIICYMWMGTHMYWHW